MTSTQEDGGKCFFVLGGLYCGEAWWGRLYIYKKLYGPFLWMGFNCLKATATLRRQFTLYHSVPRNSRYSFYRPRRDGRLSRPWIIHPMVLNTHGTPGLGIQRLNHQAMGECCFLVLRAGGGIIRCVVSSLHPSQGKQYELFTHDNFKDK